MAEEPKSLMTLGLSHLPGECPCGSPLRKQESSPLGHYDAGIFRSMQPNPVLPDNPTVLSPTFVLSSFNLESTGRSLSSSSSSRPGLGVGQRQTHREVCGVSTLSSRSRKGDPGRSRFYGGD